MIPPSSAEGVHLQGELQGAHNARDPPQDPPPDLSRLTWSTVLGGLQHRWVIPHNLHALPPSCHNTIVSCRQYPLLIPLELSLSCPHFIHALVTCLRLHREAQGHKSALMLVSELEAPAGLPMVLCISAIHPFELANIHLPGRHQQQQQRPSAEIGGRASDLSDKEVAAAVIEVTDGWYRLTATLDRPLAELVLCGKLRVSRAAAG